MNGESQADGVRGGVRSSRGWGVLAFAALSVPVAWVLLPLTFLLLEYGGTSIMMIVGIFFLPLMVLYVGVLLALVGLWWSLLDEARAAPGWTRAFTLVGIPFNLAVAWRMRESPDHYAFAFGHSPVLAGQHVTPPIVAALAGVALLAVHASRRLPPPTPRPVPPLPGQDDPLELVPWQRLSPGERDAVLFLEMNAEQVEFAGTMARSVEACEAGDPASVAGLGIRLGRDMVGWLLLKRGAAAPDWVGAESAVVSGLRIDRRHQGRGLGTIALDELPRWIARHWVGISMLMLRVDDGNAAGIRAYEKAGWLECGERRVGRVGLERTMSLRL